MMKHISIFGLVFLLLASWQDVYGEAPVGVERKSANGYRVSSDCLPPSASAQLDVNNVRTLLHNGGDMWWDLVGAPRYEVPKGSNRHSMFASSLWIGGLDESGQLRVAAQTYRQSGVDFWPGPLTGGSTGGDASTGAETCELFDKMFKINKTEIDAFRADFSDGTLDNAENYPNVMNWPAVGSPSGLDRDADGVTLEAFRDGSILYAAPFVNVDDDPFSYNPDKGDFPDIDGDQAIWWIVNDRGNVHTETGGQPIGVEIHMLSFAFTTANAVNNMTFYQQTVINRSSQSLNNTFMGQWVDSDLGKFNDDYVGCDTLRGLGYSYNADSDDDGPSGYGLNPPAIGVDFFQGPLADPNDGLDNDKDGIIDEEGETIIMSKFVYYNNDFTLIGNPEVAQHYYGYLTGFWKDGTPIVDNFTNGGDGTGYGARSPGPVSNYMFPGDACSGIGWTENEADNPRNQDRRFLQSAGPFTLQPGAVNEVVTGVVWARGFYNDQFGSVCELFSADDIAQALFDNDFQLLNGPDAPELTVSEYDQELMISWGYSEALRTVRNNFNESYSQADPVLKAQGVRDSIFEFQGYIVYQLADGTVGPNELNDPDRARIIAQCDIEDGVSTIVNRIENRVEGLDQPIIMDEVMVEGADDGIFHSVRVVRDQFAQGDNTRLKNYSTYYYGVIAYAYNDTTADGRNFVPGNRFFAVVPAQPHLVELERGGTTLASEYGEGIPVTQISGVGNGGNFVQITAESEAEVVAANGAPISAISYQADAGPITVKITDPKSVQPNYYQLEMPTGRFEGLTPISEGVIDSIFVEWSLSESTNPGGPFTEIYRATYAKRNDGTEARPMPLVGTEHVIQDFNGVYRGFSIEVQDVVEPGDTLDEIGAMGVIGASIEYADNTQAWLNGLPDNDDFAGGVWNWLLDGSDRNISVDDVRVYDKFGNFQSLLGGRWGPNTIVKGFANSEAGGSIAPGIPVVKGLVSNQVGISPTELPNFDDLPDVDIVFTNDQTKWSRCVVVETSPISTLGSGAWLQSAKWRDNVDKDGNSEGAKTPTNHGMGWFPGYAIDVNTGQRLNIFFGESEWDQLNNGDDMKWNPTSDFGNNLDRVGGRHYVYVTNLPYDECASIRDTLMNADYTGINGLSTAIEFPENGHNLSDVYKYVTWIGIPLGVTGFEFDDPKDIPTQARVSLRVNQPFGSRDEAEKDIPIFTFNTVNQAVQTRLTDVAKSALDDVLVVPNPYYAYSSYESGQLDNRVKITNLPQTCRISIFTLNGQLVRQYTKDSPAPDQDWDLKNQSGVSVASGVYIVHVNANLGEQKLGEKIIKLFAVVRQIDLDNF